MKHNLREYQKESIKNVGIAYKEGHRVIMLKLATGAGKTSIASSIIENCYKANKKALFICDRIELINQTSARFLNDGIDHGVIQAQHPMENWKKPIQVCSIQTLANRKLEELAKEITVCIIDEAHTLFKAHLRLIKILLEINPKIVIIGLSATPFTKGLGRVFTKLVVGATTQQLIDLGFLCKPVVYAPSQPDLELIKVIGGDYKQDELEQATNTPKLVGDIVEHWIKLAFDKPTIVFATSINHSKAIVDEFKRNGIMAEHIDAYTDEVSRRNIIKAFKAGIVKVLSSVDILSKGFDYPGAECAILARPTKSLSLYIQQGGRVLRISPETGKTGCLILDHAGNTERHGFITDETMEYLDNGNKKESVAIVKCKEKALPVVCPSCSMVKQTSICSNCGFEHKPKNTIVSAEGYLVELVQEDVKKSTKSVKDMLISDTFKLYAQLKFVRIDKGYKSGWEFYKFKDLVGREPTKIENLVDPMQVTTELKSYLKYLNIKSAKSKFSKFN